MRAASRSIRQRFPRLLLAGAASLATVLGLSGCQAVNGSTTAQVGQLRIVDASPDAGGLDIYSGSAAIAYNLGFGTVTSYIPVTPATYTLRVDAAGSKNALSTVRASLVNGKQYTMLVSNVLVSLQSTLLTDQSQAAPTGQIALRFLDEAIAVGSVDLYLVPSGSTLAKVNPISTGLVLGTNTGYINVPTGTYTLYVIASGAVISANTIPAFTGASTTYPAGSARTVLLLDTQIVTAPSVQAITVNDYDSAIATQ